MSSTLAVGIRHLRSKLAMQQRREDSDEQSLHAFLTQRDDSAFAVLVRRHGPMVMHVCRCLLKHQQDAEDAFQATLLVLARNGAALRKKASLASFLHGIAYRTAMKAKRTAARRRKRESDLGALTQPRSPAGLTDELSWREVRSLLNEEIARLPEIYRSVFVLCHLEDLSRAEAAQRLGLKERTVLSRLTVARKRLAWRLARRGVELTAVLAASVLATQPASASLTAATVQAATATAAGGRLAGLVSASVADLVEGTAAAFLTRAKLVMVIFAASVLAGAGAWMYRSLDALALAPSALAMPEPPPAAQTAAKPKQPNNTHEDKNDTVEVRGTVVDPDGKPFRDARVYFQARQRIMQADPEPGFARIRASTDADGRFRFRVARNQVQPLEHEETRFVHNAYPHAVVTAVAAGRGPGWAVVRKVDEAGNLTLKLVKDDVPLRGRVVDLEGRPIQGVKVRVMLLVPMQTESLSPWLVKLQVQKKNGSAIWRFQGAEIYPEAAGLEKAIVTDADGRFQLQGLGRERVARLRFEGPTIATHDAFVLARPGPTFELPYPYIPPSKETYAYHGAGFEHAAGPTVPLVGTVRDKDTGKPLAGIVLQARIPSPEGDSRAEGGPATDYLRTITDKDGQYRLVGLPKQADQIVRAFSGPGQAYVRLGKIVPAGVGLNPVRVDFELKRGVLIRGRVTDKATGRPVSAAIEYFILSDNQDYVEGAGSRREGGSLDTRTGEDGSFSLVGLPRRGIVAAKIWSAKAGSYIMAAGAERIKGANRNGVFLAYPFACNPNRYHSLQEVNPAPDAESVVCNLVADHGKTVTGTVLGPDGKPLTGVRMEGPLGIWGRVEPLKTTRFTLSAINPNQPQWVHFYHKEKQLGAAVRLTGDEPKDFPVRLQPCATVTGRVMDSEGRPRAGIELSGSIGPWQHPPSQGWGGFWGAKTDKNGHFRVTGLIPGLKWRTVYVQEGGMLTGQLLSQVIFQAGETKELGDLPVLPLEEE